MKTVDRSGDLPRGRALLLLAVITAAGAWFRFYNLGWGAPYFHFHIDEHIVFVGADLMRRSMRSAAMSAKFFMYSPLPMYAVNLVRHVYETVSHPLVLTVPADEVTYMLLGRAISATLGTAAIPIAYAIGSKLSDRTAGLLSAAFLAVAVIHLRESHFFSVDIAATFFVMLTWLAALRMAERGSLSSVVLASLAFAGGILSKYSAAFMALPVAFAHLVSPTRPKTLAPVKPWTTWIVRGVIAAVVVIVVFFAVDPLVLEYFQKFRDDIQTWVTDPLTGVSRPIWIAQFADVRHFQLYWFTNLLWWAMGPAFEIWALAGVVWLVIRRDRLSLLSALVPVAYFLAAGRTIAPFIRYTVPLVATLAVPAGVLGADLIGRRRGLRIVGIVLTGAVLAVTALYAAAYMNVFRQTDSRIAAARYLRHTLPVGAAIMVEPSQTLPPMGDYYDKIDFYSDYVPWGAETERSDYFHRITLDTYTYLYDLRRSDAEKRAYIAGRLAKADWIVMDDTFLQFYQHLPEDRYGVVKHTTAICSAAAWDSYSCERSRCTRRSSATRSTTMERS